MERLSNVKSRPRLPIPDEDPYYIPGTVMTRITDSSDSSGYGGHSANSGRGSGNNTDCSGISYISVNLTSSAIFFNF